LAVLTERAKNGSALQTRSIWFSLKLIPLRLSPSAMARRTIHHVETLLAFDNNPTGIDLSEPVTPRARAVHTNPERRASFGSRFARRTVRTDLTHFRTLPV